jgi:extracellular factor (EF) 3-hydroxypalmitic acid methyl ester biosynthesis protein
MITRNGEAIGATNGVHGETDSFVAGVTGQGTEIHAALLRYTRYQAVFEIYGSPTTLRTSEVLEDFKIVIGDRPIYAGRAVVRSMVSTGTTAVCEVALTESFWLDVGAVTGDAEPGGLGREFNQFVENWQKAYLVTHEYKAVVADLQTFLSDLRLWLEQVELRIHSAPAADQTKMERDIALGLRDSVIPAIGSLFERFEAVAQNIEEELRPAHRAFGKRQLHPLLLCAPFIHRTYTKPLGYAGDYEMMNMIVRNGLEGDSLFAKLTNAYLLDQTPAHAVRNRIGYLSESIIQETSRLVRLGRAANVFCVACGPAWEVVNFLAGHPLAEQARFQLLDFNEETLQATGQKINAVRRQQHRQTPVKLVKNSVQNLLRNNGKAVAPEAGFDLIYCSGLYDYLNDRVCKALSTRLYEMLLPGGLLVIGNFAPSTPIRNLMEHLLEWFLIYRDGKQLSALAPEPAAREHCAVRAEPTGTNLFLEVRKPA